MANEKAKGTTTTKSERENAAEIMNKAGYACVTPDMVKEVPNKYNVSVYSAYIGKAVVLCVPKFGWTLLIETE